MELEQTSILTVSQLNSEAKALLEGTFFQVWVEGEISNFSAPQSGHWYFSLKDDKSQVRCALFRGNQRGLGFTPKDGSHVLVRARVSLYEPRGDYQLIADFMEERGEGKLRRAYELLRKKCEAAGLFDDAHKKPLPTFPTQIGIITSNTGAALHDILTVLKRRSPITPVIIYPTLVQGELAANQLIKAIETANQRCECDVLILARGGGSLEDLWPFNDEALAHAIFNSHIPIISGVGHEVDFTIADFVADVRAPTPSAAAEMVAPDHGELLQILNHQVITLKRSILNLLKQKHHELHALEKHLGQQHPKSRLIEKMQQLDFYQLALSQGMQMKLEKIQAKLRNLSGKLDTLSPLATLQRGYCFTTKQEKVVSDVNGLKIKDLIDVRFANGSAICEVKATELLK